MPAEVQPVTANDGVAVTKSDNTIYNPPLDAIYVAGAGDVTVITNAGNSLLITAVAGVILPIKCKKVMSTGTDATGIVGLKYA